MRKTLCALCLLLVTGMSIAEEVNCALYPDHPACQSSESAVDSDSSALDTTATTIDTETVGDGDSESDNTEIPSSND